MKKTTIAAGAVSAIAAALAIFAKSKQKSVVQETLRTARFRQPRRVLIVGATSAIAQETAKEFAADGDKLFLVARNAEKLQVVANDLRVRGASQVETAVLDVNDTDRHAEILSRAAESLGGLDVALIAHGTLSDQPACQQSAALTEREMRTNFLSVVLLLTVLANQFEAQRHGTVAVISSVAGDRGRKSNYVYGAAKAGVTAFLSGLRGRLDAAGVRVITIKPGMVDTPMTAHLEKGLLFASAETVGKGIYRAIVTGQEVVYLPWFWWVIMTVLRHVPEAVYKKLNF